MKMKKVYYYQHLLYVLLFCLMTFSCEKEESSNLHISGESEVDLQLTVDSKNGVLIFKDDAAVKTILDELSLLTREERKHWEDQLDFESQLRIFGNIVDAELAIDEPYEAMTELERQNAPAPPEHSDLYYKYLDQGMIKVIGDSDDPDYESYDYTICFPYMASVVNADGIFIVGKTIYQLTSTSIKIWENGNIEDLQKLKTTEVSTDDITIESLNNGEKGAFNPNPKTSNWIYDVPKRAKLEEYFSSWQYYGDGSVWQYQHWVHVRTEKKNIWGNYKLYWTTMHLRGYTNTDFDWHYPGDSPQTIHFYADYPSNYPSWDIQTIYNFYSTISIFDGSIGGNQYVTYSISYAPGTIISGVDVTSSRWETWCFGTINIVLQ